MTLIEIFENVAFVLMLWLAFKQHQILSAQKEERRDLEIQKRFKNLFVAAGLPADTKHNFHPDGLKND